MIKEEILKETLDLEALFFDAYEFGPESTAADIHNEITVAAKKAKVEWSVKEWSLFWKTLGKK